MIKLHVFFDNHEWTQNTCARNDRNQAVSTSDENACKFCVLGALYKIYGDPIPEDILNSVARVFHNGDINDAMGIITTFNDSHTKEEVLTLLRQADV